MIVGWFMVLIVSRLTARNLLLAERSWKPGFGRRHGGEKGVNLLLVIACLEIKEKRIKRVR